MKRMFDLNIRGTIVPVSEQTSLDICGEFRPWDKTIAVQNESDYTTIIHEIIHAIIDQTCNNRFSDDKEEEVFVDFFEKVVADFIQHNKLALLYIIHKAGEKYGKPARRNKTTRKRSPTGRHPSASTGKPGRSQGATGGAKQPRKQNNKPRVKA